MLPDPRSRRGHRPIGPGGLVASASGLPRNLSVSPGTAIGKVLERQSRLAGVVHPAVKLPHALGMQSIGNFSDTSSFKSRRSKGSIGHAFTVRIRTGNQNQTSFYPFVPHEISVLVELILGHLRYLLTDVPPQPNSPPDNVFRPDRPAEAGLGTKRRGDAPPPTHGISKITLKVVVFHLRRRDGSHLSYTSQVISQSRTRVKLNRVFFPR